jgi:cytochrome b561
MEYEPIRPKGYSGAQIGLHWLIAALVFFQLIFGESIKEAAEALERDGSVPADLAFSANLHVYAGVAILVLAVVRLVLRLGLGAPAAPEGTPRLQALFASTVHWAFYLLLIGVPVSGLVAWFVTPAAGAFHTLAKPVFIVLILVHLAGVVIHQFVGKESVAQRMITPAK